MVRIELRFPRLGQVGLRIRGERIAEKRVDRAEDLGSGEQDIRLPLRSDRVMVRRPVDVQPDIRPLSVNGGECWTETGAILSRYCCRVEYRMGGRESGVKDPSVFTIFPSVLHFPSNVSYLSGPLMSDMEIRGRSWETKCVAFSQSMAVEATYPAACSNPAPSTRALKSA